MKSINTKIDPISFTLKTIIIIRIVYFATNIRPYLQDNVYMIDNIIKAVPIFICTLPLFTLMHEIGHALAIKLTSKTIKNFSDKLTIKCSFTYTWSNFYQYLVNNKNNQTILDTIKINATSGRIAELITIIFVSMLYKTSNVLIFLLTTGLFITSIFTWNFGTDKKYYEKPISYEYKPKKPINIRLMNWIRREKTSS